MRGFDGEPVRVLSPSSGESDDENDGSVGLAAFAQHATSDIGTVEQQGDPQPLPSRNTQLQVPQSGELDQAGTEAGAKRQGEEGEGEGEGEGGREVS